jgi:hypothetical protein
MIDNAARPRPYPALAEYVAAARRGCAFGVDHPIAQAARYEANAQELYAWADGPATSPTSRETWLAAADEEMAKAARILIDAERRARVAAG